MYNVYFTYCMHPLFVPCVVLPHVGKVISPRRNFQRLSSFLEVCILLTCTMGGICSFIHLLSITIIITFTITSTLHYHLHLSSLPPFTITSTLDHHHPSPSLHHSPSPSFTITSTLQHHLHPSPSPLFTITSTIHHQHLHHHLHSSPSTSFHHSHLPSYSEEMRYQAMLLELSGRTEDPCLEVQQKLKVT